MKLAAPALLAFAALALPSLAADKLPDGTYSCTLMNSHFGDFQIVGETYKGPTHDGNFTEGGSFIYLEPGKIYFLDEPKGIIDMGYRVDSTKVTDADGKVGFDMVVLQDGASEFSTATCLPSE